MLHSHHAALGSYQSAFLTLILVFAALFYLRGAHSLRSNFLNLTSAWPTVGFLFGLFLIWIAVASSFAMLDHELLTVHMVQHLLLMTLAPPLIWLGAPTRSILQGLPRRLVESLFTPLRHSRLVKKILEIVARPRFCWLAACAVLVGWHIPKFFALGMQSASWHLFEQVSFLAAGLLFWWPVIEPSRATPQQDFSIILYLFFATLPCDILAGFLVFSDRVAYPMYFSSAHLSGFSPLLDQQCAAALMWTCITLVYFVAGAILTTRLLSPNGISQVPSVQSKWTSSATPQGVSQSLEVR